MAPSLFDKFRYFNRNLALAVTLVAVSTFNYGFDNQAFATTQSMEPFIRQFGVYNETSRAYELEAYWLSLFSSLNYIGFAFGVVIGSMVSARWGRRWCMFSMSCYALVTATIAVTSQTGEQIMAARILNYIYVGMELSVIPTFQSELVPAAARGFIVGSYQFSLLVGGLVINSVCYGTARRFADNRAWRIPIGLFYIVPTIVGSLVLFIPESPRWLLRKNRIDEAKASLRKLRESAFTQDEIESEFAELRLALEQEQEQGRFRELFDKHNIKRTLIVIGVNFFQQATGQAFASQYGAIYVRSLVPMTATLFLTDRIGRRSLLMLSSVAMLGCLFAMGGLGVQSPVSTERKRGIVGMLSLFGVSFATGWGPLTYVVATEVSALRLRDQTARLGFGVNVVINFAVNFMIPYLISDSYVGLGSKVGFIFGCMAVLSFIFTYYAVPECKGKSLEQIDLMLKNGVRLRDFGKTENGEIRTEPVFNTSLNFLSLFHLFDGLNTCTHGIVYITVKFTANSMGPSAKLNQRWQRKVSSFEGAGVNYIMVEWAAERRRGLTDTSRIGILQTMPQEKSQVRQDWPLLWGLFSLALELLLRQQQVDIRRRPRASVTCDGGRLNYEHHGIEPAKQESQRRLLWAIYQLDRMLSGGVEDLAVCPVERMHIRLPCDDHSFHRDIPSRAPRLNDYEHSDALSVGILAYHIRLNATRDRILRMRKPTTCYISIGFSVIAIFTAFSFQEFLEFQKPVNDVFFAISIYQVTQIINHLCQLLPQNGPHCLQNVKASLYGALDLAKPLRKMYPRVENCLKDIGHLLQVLGQNAGDIQKPTNRGSKPNLHHLPSLHSLIPEYSEQNGVVIDLPALGTGPRTVAAPEPLQAMSTQPPHTLPVIPQLSDHIVRPYLQSGECDSLNFVEQTEFEPANIFDMQFNGYYDPVQNDLISAFVV
ncbi:hypothetical protein TruAng_005688 [Truncatella angustata]|nr:hypothetical protein TruAng_005688 [Truncatella angustata]